MPDDTLIPLQPPEVLAAGLAERLATAIAAVPFGTADLTGDRVKAILAVLREDGWILDGVPPVRQVLADGRQFADELIMAKLVARFFRVMILGGLVIPETPAAMDWLRDYIDGTHSVHGPLGKPMLWPGRLPAIVGLLRQWGFQPTPTNPQFVSLRPGGALAPSTLPDPEAPDRASVPPIAPEREAVMGALLDEFTGGITVGAVNRGTAVRAMSAAFDRGASHCEIDPVDPVIIAAMVQLRDHQEQADADGAQVTVSRQALDEVLAFVENEEGRG